MKGGEEEIEVGGRRGRRIGEGRREKGGGEEEIEVGGRRGRKIGEGRREKGGGGGGDRGRGKKG